MVRIQSHYTKDIHAITSEDLTRSMTPFEEEDEEPDDLEDDEPELDSPLD